MTSSALLVSDILSGLSRCDAKQNGAYYTDDAVAEFLVRWALPQATGKVLDPSFGGGVFLRAASDMGRGRREIFGVELDDTTHATVDADLNGKPGISASRLIRADFFEVDPAQLPAMDAVVGNPPFVRYQRFTGAAREIALLRAKQAGVTLPKSTSSWAPFLIHAVQFIKEGGRLGMVLPMELGYASYAKPVLAHLAKNFRRLQILAFRKALFPSISEDVVVVLATDKGPSTGSMAAASLHDLEDAKSLLDFDADEDGVDIAGFLRGHRRLAEFFLPETTRELYAHVEAAGLACRLRKLADVGIGYVSGNNHFFHPDRTTQTAWKIPQRYLKRAVFNGSAFTGLEFTEADWEKTCAQKAAGHLLALPEDENALPSGVRSYLESGRSIGVDKAYKCAARRAWHVVPQVYQAEGFLTYMSGMQTRLVANAAYAVAPNTLHLVRLHRDATMGIYEIAARWHTSLTQLSAEIEGHALGGGMLKLEPREAGRVLIPEGHAPTVLTEDTAREFDALLRQGKISCVRDLADRIFLRDELGLSATDAKRLAEGALSLRNRRISRKKNTT